MAGGGESFVGPAQFAESHGKIGGGGGVIGAEPQALVEDGYGFAQATQAGGDAARVAQPPIVKSGRICTTRR